jgi:perosamine synthetase
MGWFVYVVTLAEGLERGEVMRAMEARGIPVRGYFSPVHLQPYLKEFLGPQTIDLPVTCAVASRTIALPFHNNMTPAQVDQVVTTLQESVGCLT